MKSLQQPYGIGAIIIPILQMKKVRPRGLNNLLNVTNSSGE